MRQKRPEGFKDFYFNQRFKTYTMKKGIMPISWWFGVKFVPGGLGSFHSLLNSFIHILMYLYYAIAAMGPQYQKFLGWKKCMTSLQMVNV